MLGAMSNLVTILIAVLGALAILHSLWGFGVWVPLRKEADLVKAVIGGRNITRMPGPIPCALVAAGMLVIIGGLLGRGNGLADLVLWVAVVVFAGRGVASYVPLWRKMTPQEPFATFDQRYYGPLCLVLALGIAIAAL